MSWIVYILECADKTLYTGITTDMANRLARHAKGIGAKYTRGRGPYIVLYTEPHATKSSALQRERWIKALTKEQKRLLVTGKI